MSIYLFNRKVVTCYEEDVKGDHLSRWHVACPRCRNGRIIHNVRSEEPISHTTESVPNYVPAQIMDAAYAMGLSTKRHKIKCARCGGEDLECRVLGVFDKEAPHG
jgi:ribosomal protein S27AE